MRRRLPVLLASLVAVAVLAGSCGAGGPQASQGSKAEPRGLELGFKPKPSQPLRIMLWGDSVLFTIEPTLVKALQATGAATVFPQAFPGWGLSTDTHWRHNLSAMLAADRPDLVVGMWVWDASWAKRDPKGYAAALDAYVRRCLHGPHAARAVLLLDWPKMADVDRPMASNGTYPERDPEGHAAWLAAAKRVAAKHPGRVQLAELTSSMLLGGRPAIWLPPNSRAGAPTSAWVRARHDDGVHVCPEAAGRFSAQLLLYLHREVGLPMPAASWRDRPLTPTSSDVLWQAVITQQEADQQGATTDCPADHPPVADNGRTP